MKRRTNEVPNEELVSKHRLIHRRRSISPPGFETRPKRSREEQFPRYNRSHEHDEYKLSSKEERFKTGFSSSDKYQHQFQDQDRERSGKDSYHMGSDRSRRPPASPSSELFDYSLRVANIDYGLTDNAVRHNLFQEFKRFGYVNIKVIGYARDRHAYINFNRAADAKTACREMQGFSLHGRQLEVGWSRTTLNRYPDLLTEKFNEPRGSNSRKKEQFDDDYHSSDHHRRESFSSRTREPGYKPKGHERAHITTEKPLSTAAAAVLDSNATRTLFVGNLEIDITERELRDIFSPYGRIESVDIKSSKTIAYSFVKFFTINDAIEAKNQLNGRMYGELKLSIGFGKGTPATKVWIGNISCYADVSEIRKELDRFGLIRRVDYLNEDNHCYVHFDSQDAAEAAIASLQNYRFKRSNKPLRIDLLKTREFGAYDFEPDAGSGYESVVSSTTGTRNDDRYKQRAMDFHKDRDPHNRSRTGSRSFGDNSLKFSSERFKPPYRKRDRSPHMHGDYNGEYRTKRYKNGHDSNYRSDRQREHNSTSSQNKEKESLNSDKNDGKISPKEDQKNDENDETKSVLSGGSDIPPPPSTIPSETDTALNLNPGLELPASGKIPIADSAETLGDLAKLYPMAWHGNLVLKNTGFPTRMHLIGGDPAVVEVLVKWRDSSESSSLKITQRLRLEPPRLDEVNKRMASAGPSGHCVLIALPGPTPSQSSP